MIYTDISGWFDFEAFYDKMIDQAPASGFPGPLFVEIGCWLGKSTAYLASKILGSQKRIKLHVFDTFQGSDNEPQLLEYAGKVNIEAEFARNMHACGLAFVNMHSVSNGQRMVSHAFEHARFAYGRLLSTEASATYINACLDFVFLDGCHTFDAVSEDIRSWKPKLKPGGILAGHDYNTYDSVRQAVNKAFANKHQVEGNCWWIKL